MQRKLHYAVCGLTKCTAQVASHAAQCANCAARIMNLQFWYDLYDNCDVNTKTGYFSEHGPERGDLSYYNWKSLSKQQQHMCSDY